jgi:hypothetical protein
MTLILFGLAAIASAALLLWAIRDPIFVAAFLAGLIGIGGVLLLIGRRPAAASVEPGNGTPDLSLIRATPAITHRNLTTVRIG